MTDDEGVRRTIAEFCQYLDDRRFEDWSNLFTSDGEFQHLAGREAILSYIQNEELATIPELTRKHMVANVVVDISGDEARATSDLVMVDRMADGPWKIRVGDYTDHLVRDGERWLFTKRVLVMLD
jgi:hypothetical protein